jgi:hypothetical protein
MFQIRSRETEEEYHKTNDWLWDADENTVVYVIEASVETNNNQYYYWVKLGYSGDLDNRIYGSLSYGWDRNTVIEDVQVIRFLSRYAAHDYEQYLHDKYDEKKINPQIMKRFHKNNGHTECYNAKMKHIFLNEFFSTGDKYETANIPNSLEPDTSHATKINNLPF